MNDDSLIMSGLTMMQHKSSTFMHVTGRQFGHYHIITVGSAAPPGSASAAPLGRLRQLSATSDVSVYRRRMRTVNATYSGCPTRYNHPLATVFCGRTIDNENHKPSVSDR